jgi:hypothetical protein
MQKTKLFPIIFILLDILLPFPAEGRIHGSDSIIVNIEQVPYDLFNIDSSITVNDGYTYTTDSLAVIAILKASGWGMPIKDSSSAYVTSPTVEDISAKVNGRIVKLDLSYCLTSIYWAAYGSTTNHSLFLPSDIGNLTALQFLHISTAETVALDSLPVEIGNLSNMISFICNGTHITKLPASIGNFRTPDFP